MRKEKSKLAIPVPRRHGGALPKKQGAYFASLEGQSGKGSSIRSNNKPLRIQGEGPTQDKGVLPFAIRSLYRVVVRFADVDTLAVAICMDLLLSVHSDDESLRYFPDLTDAEASERIIKRQGLTIFIATACCAEQLKERFEQSPYVAEVGILAMDQLAYRELPEASECEEAN